MKTKIFVLLLLMFCINVNLNAQQPNEYKNLISFNITRLFSSNMTMCFERQINTNYVSFNAGITLKEGNFETLIGFNLELQYRLFSKNKADSSHYRFFLAPVASYKYLDQLHISNNTSNKYYYNDYSLGMVFGMRFLIFDGFILTTELGAVLRYSDNNKGRSSSYFDHGYNGIAPKADVTIGYFF